MLIRDTAFNCLGEQTTLVARIWQPNSETIKTKFLVPYRYFSFGTSKQIASI